MMYCCQYPLSSFSFAVSQVDFYKLVLHTQCPRLWSYRVILNHFTTLCRIQTVKLKTMETIEFWGISPYLLVQILSSYFCRKGLTQYSFYRSNSFAKSCTSINCTFLLDTSLIICHEVKRELLQKFRVSCYIYPSTRLTLVSHISLFMSWKLLKPPEKSEDEDSDFYVISEESTDEEDNGLRQEYHTNRARLCSRKEFEFTKLLNICFIVQSYDVFSRCITFLLKLNHWDPNIVDTAGALFTLSLSSIHTELPIFRIFIHFLPRISI